MHYTKKVDWSRASIDGSVIQAKGGANSQDPNPVDRGRPGSKHHIITDRKRHSACCRPHLPPMFMIVKCWSICWIICHPCEICMGNLPAILQKLHADKGYDYPFCRQACTARHIKHRIARRGVESSSHLGKHRWVVERTFAWLHRYRRLLVRYERRADNPFGLPHTCCCFDCFSVLLGTLN